MRNALSCGMVAAAALLCGAALWGSRQLHPALPFVAVLPGLVVVPAGTTASRGVAGFWAVYVVALVLWSAAVMAVSSLWLAYGVT